MAPLRINPVGPFGPGELEFSTIAGLCSCFVLCIFLVVKRLRNRPSMPRFEQLTPYPTEKQVGGDIFDDRDPLSSTDRQLLTELLNPLLGVGPRKSSLINSGYLAAKAKMASAKKLAVLATTDDQVTVLALQVQDTNHHSSNEQQKLQWSRRSSPGPRAHCSNIQSTNTTEYDDMEHLIRSSSLHNESKVDETRHFSDDHDPRIKWRRRTLIFEKTP